MTTPVVRSSTFSAPSAAALGERMRTGEGLVYSRLDNPTVAALEARLAELEGAEAALATASGMGAIHITLMSLLEPGARMVVDPCVYGCTHSLLQRLAGWGVEVVPCRTSDPGALEAALEPGADVVYLESPMNPTLRVVDLDRAAEHAHTAGATLVVDNTFATPALQRPLDHGADLVVHSLTKAVNGHSDLLAGALAGPRDLLEEIHLWRKDAGPVLDPETAWLVLRGLETLELRVQRMAASARQLAEHLAREGHQVGHPMLTSHPDHSVATRMLAGCSVFTLDLGSQANAQALIDGLEVFVNAVSLGGIESLVCHPASTTHAPMDEDSQAQASIPEGMVRFSVGIEDVGLLAQDLERGLAGIEAAPRIEAA